MYPTHIVRGKSGEKFICHFPLVFFFRFCIWNNFLFSARLQHKFIQKNNDPLTHIYVESTNKLNENQNKTIFSVLEEKNSSKCQLRQAQIGFFWSLNFNRFWSNMFVRDHFVYFDEIRSLLLCQTAFSEDRVLPFVPEKWYFSVGTLQLPFKLLQNNFFQHMTRN